MDKPAAKKAPASPSKWKNAPILAPIGVGYFLVALIGMAFTVKPLGIAAVWPASGYALAVLLLRGRKHIVPTLLALFIANAVSNLIAGNSLAVTIGFACSNTVESAIWAWLLLWWVGPRITFTRRSEVFALVVVAAAFNALTGVMGAAVASYGFGARFIQSWAVWWVADGLGIILVTPAIVQWAIRRWTWTFRSWPRLIEGAILIAIWLALTRVSVNSATYSNYPITRAYMLFPILIWVALRFGPRATATALLAFGAMAVWSIAQGRLGIPLETSSVAMRLWALQVFLAVTSISGLFLAAEISERERAEEALRAGETRYRSLFNNARNAFLLTDDFARFVDANPAGCELVGYQREELLKMNAGHITPARHRLRTMKDWKEFLRTGIQEGEYTILRRDGTEIEVAYRGVANVLPGLHLAVLLDITERKRAEQNLFEREQEFRTLVEHLPYIVSRFDRNLRHLYMSPAAESVTGLPPESFLGKTNRELGMPDGILTMWDNALRHVFDTGEELELEFGFPMDDEVRQFETVLVPERAQDGSIRSVLSVNRDVTERKRDEQERTKLEMQLQQSHKLESIGKLAGGVAHDFNNMLTPILVYADMLLDTFPAEHRGHMEALQISRAATHARDLIAQLLAFARKQTMEMKPLDLNALLVDFEKMLRRTLRENVKVEFVPANALGVVEGDNGQIEQVVLNLAVNAADAMPQGGCLRIETAEVNLSDPSELERLGLAAGDYIVLSLVDTGIGMQKETVARIFDPFFTTKEMGRGTGLGLATVYGIVKQHGGAISVESELGVGTAFRVYFPRKERQVEPWPTPVAPISPARGSETVLVAEDQEQVRVLAREVLEQCGYTVIDAMHGREALDVADAHPGRIDLLITDVIMPDMNGKRLYELMVAKRPDIRVLYMSGYTADVISVHGNLDPEVNFLQKPFTLRAFADKVREALES